MGFIFTIFLVIFQLVAIRCNSFVYRSNSSRNGCTYSSIKYPKVGLRNRNGIGTNKTLMVFSESENLPSSNLDSEDRGKKIKLLRSTTGRGAQECYKALNKANGDVRLASQILLDELNECKKDEGSGSEVVTSLEGTIAISCNPKACCIIDMRCDTDFVAKNNLFKSFAKSFCNSGLVSAIESSGSSKSLEDLKNEVLNRKCLKCGNSLLKTGSMVKAAIREDISVSRIGFLNSDPGEFFVFYIHSSLDPKKSTSYSGSSASILSFGLEGQSEDSFYSFFDDELKTSETNCCMFGSECVFTKDRNITDFHLDPELNEFKKFLRQIAIHVVAEKPKEMDLETFDKDSLEQSEKELETLVSSGKPRDIAEKIVKGKLRKKFGQYVLMEQVFMYGENGASISESLVNMSNKFGCNISLKKFITYAISDDLINFRHPQNCKFYNTNIKF